jgi:hypothetical protein
MAKTAKGAEAYSLTTKAKDLYMLAAKLHESKEASHLKPAEERHFYKLKFNKKTHQLEPHVKSSKGIGEDAGESVDALHASKEFLKQLTDVRKECEKHGNREGIIASDKALCEFLESPWGRGVLDHHAEALNDDLYPLVKQWKDDDLEEKGELSSDVYKVINQTHREAAQKAEEAKQKENEAIEREWRRE